ncbi:class I SAM-dependent methyltransferase [Brevundimonas sp. UBA2416]|uniref:class I SAM-dependent methyltransferase n=1 Tax=Brevundimonas sp. UBA2416 TaxID=1946124 RepID=UPI0025B93FC2|nr:methyltransferase domain-containing protein [Brevundimonas sp. UBA2416]HRJ64930.1 methyltransferase domain-containing protein [Brevundimonas sp.]
MSSSPSEKRRGWHWSDYWRSGRTDVMTVQTPTGPIAFDTEPVWAGWFQTFGAGAQLLDVATGNGQVAGYASRTAASAGQAFAITGVDYADIESAGARPLDGCRLMGGVALEKLPFPAASFDGASSQFGIEYADTRSALQELGRVLKPGGRALMLIHHSDSVITRQTVDQIAAYDAVLGKSGAIRHARRAFTAHLKGLPAAAAEEALRTAVQQAVGRLQPTAAFEPVRYFVGYLDDLARGVASFEPESALARLDVFETGNAAWRHRQQSQTLAALDGPGRDLFILRAGRAGLVLTESDEMIDGGGQLIGWRVAFRKA